MSTALITGASIGIGRALAIEFARGGHNVLLVARDESQLKQTAEACRRHNVEAKTFPCDLMEPGAAERVFAWAGHADVLVNNAGFGVHGTFLSTDGERELQMVQLQISVLLKLTKLFLPGMVARRSGRVLNVSSVYAFSGVPQQTVYGACKAFLFVFSQGLAEEVRANGVSVTVLCPGSTRTEFRTRAGIREKSTKSGMSAEAVAAAGYRATMRGNLLEVPGRINRLFVFLARHLPVTWVGQLVTRINRVRLGKHG